MFVDVPKCTVVVETSLTSSHIHSLLEATGLPVFFKGFGSSIESEGEIVSLALVCEIVYTSL